MKKQINPMKTLAAVVALSHEGFFVGITGGSYVVANKGTVYIFDRQTTDRDEIKSFGSRMFGLLCDPSLDSSFRDPIVSKWKPMDNEESFGILGMIEGDTHPLLFIPKEDWELVFAKTAAREAAEMDTDASKVTLH